MHLVWFVERAWAACDVSFANSHTQSHTQQSDLFIFWTTDSEAVTWALTIWIEFSVAFSGHIELHFFPLRKRNRLNCIIWSEVSDTSGPGSRYISATRNMAAELHVVLEVLSDDLENYFFQGEYDNFICLAATTSTFRKISYQPRHPQCFPSM